MPPPYRSTDPGGSTGLPGAIEIWYARLAIALGGIGWAAVALAEVGMLSRLTTLASAVLAAVAAGALIRQERPPRPADRARRGAGAALLCVVAIAALASLPPRGRSLWEGDATVAFNEARQIALHGGFVFEDPVLASLSHDQRVELFANRTFMDASGSYARFPGGFSIPSPEDTRVSAGFSPLYPAVGAAVLLWLPPGAMALVAPAFAVLAALGLALLGTHLTGLRLGLLAASALAVSLPQVWFARTGAPALPAQFFLVAGLIVLAMASRHDPLRRLLAAGLLLGVSPFAKVDLVATLSAGMAAALAAHLLPFRESRAGAAGAGGREVGSAGTMAFFGAYGLLLAHNVAHYTLLPTHYGPWLAWRARDSLLGRFAQSVGQGVPSSLVAAAAAAAVGTVMVALLRRRLGARRTLGVVLSLALLAWGANYVASNAFVLDRSLEWLTWYLSAPVVGLAIAGVLLVPAELLARARQGAAGLLRHEGIPTIWVVLTVAAAHYLYDPQATGEQIDSVRRFIPVVFPWVLLLGVVGLGALVDAVTARSRATSSRVPFALAGVLFFGAVVRPTLPLLELEPAGSADVALARIADEIPGQALVLVSADLAGTHVATSLAYLHDRQTILLQATHPRAGTLEALVVERLGSGQPVYFLLGADGLHFAAPRLGLEPVDELDISVPSLEITRDRRPGAQVQRVARVSLLRAAAHAGEPKAGIDVGTVADDTLFELEGFHGAERGTAPGDPTYRWTEAVATVWVPGDADAQIVVDSARPPSAAPAVVDVWLDGQQVIRGLELAPGTTRLLASHPAIDAGARRRLVLRSSTFNPRALGISEDARELGVQVYGIRFLKPAPATPRSR